MKKKLENYKAYTKIKKYSEVDINFTDSQKSLLYDLLGEIGEIYGLLTNSREKVGPDLSIFLLPMLNEEARHSLLIEGTRTQFEDIAYNIKGINTRNEWENRNLVNLYKKWIRQAMNDDFTWSIDIIEQIHKELFTTELGSFNLNYNPQQLIKEIKPGLINTNDEIANWIGSKSHDRDYDFENAILIPIKPSLKREWLNDLLNTINLKIKNKELTIEDIVKFHPIFEAIHPFSDGNGRMGRLLLSCLFSAIKLGKHFPILISEFLEEDREIYMTELRKVQIENRWNSWQSFFIGKIIQFKKNYSNRIKRILNIWDKLNSFNEFNKYEEIILLSFFKYYRIQRKHTINIIVNMGCPESTAYKHFNKISSLLKAKKIDEYYSFEDLKTILTTKYI